MYKKVFHLFVLYSVAETFFKETYLFKTYMDFCALTNQIKIFVHFINAVIILLSSECSGQVCPGDSRSDFIMLCSNRSQAYRCIDITDSIMVIDQTPSIRYNKPASSATLTATRMTSTLTIVTEVPRVNLQLKSSDSLRDLEKVQPENFNQVKQLVGNSANVSRHLQTAIRAETDPVVKWLQGLKLLSLVFKTGELALSAKAVSLLRTLKAEVQKQFVCQIFAIYETSGPLIASTLSPGFARTLNGNVTDMIVSNIDLRASGESVRFQYASDSVSIPTEALRSISQGKRVLGVSSVLFKGVSPMFSPEETENTQEKNEVNSIFNSKVIMVSVENKSTVFSKDITITMELRVNSRVSDPVCYSLSFNSSRLETTGCVTKVINTTHIACSCNHATSFAILTSFRTDEPEASSDALSILTYACCSFSIVCLVLSYATFVSFDIIKSERNTVHANLTLCLALGQLLFLIGVNQVGNQKVCSLIAGALHYLFLAAFCWMGLEGWMLYSKLVFYVEFSFEPLPFYFLFGYGIPSFIVAVAAGFNFKGYGTKKACWLSKESGFIWSFLGPVVLITILNAIVLGLCCFILYRQFKSSTKKDTTSSNKMKTWLKGTAMLSCLLGVTWIFGLLQFGGVGTDIFSYIFVLLNGTQGVFIFFFHCLGNDKIKKAYRKVLRRATWIPLPCRKLLFAGVRTASARNLSQATGRAEPEGTLSMLQGGKSVQYLMEAPAPAPLKLQARDASAFSLMQQKKSADEAGELRADFRSSNLAIPTATPEMLLDSGIYFGYDDGGIYCPDTSQTEEKLAVERVTKIASNSEVEAEGTGTILELITDPGEN